jgi:glycosyltransferase involved in cell wall biosynthesis
VKNNVRSPRVCLIFNANQPVYFNTAMALRHNSFDATVLCLGYRSQTEEEVLADGTMVKKIRWDGIYSSPFYSILNPLTRIRLTIAAWKEKADLYAGYTYFTLTTLLWLKLCGKRVIYVIGDDDPSNFARVIKNNLHLGFIAGCMEKLFRWFENAAIQKCDYVITNTDSLQNRRKIHTSKIKTIYLCPNQSFNPSNCDRQLLDRYQNYDIIVYSGTVSWQKSLREILEAFELIRTKHDRALLMIVGGIEKSEENDIRELLGQKTNVVLTGWLPNAEMPKYINLGKVGFAIVNPISYSYMISLPNKVLEQMACGLPVIVPRGFPEIEKIMREARCGLMVDVHDKQQLAKAALDLLDNVSLRKEMSANALAYISRHHSLEHYEEEIMAVVRLVLKNNGH